ncbi:hypothetical protein F511_25233 [Dorcoceras hygrometricum]|uniref:Dystroglycan-like n=1 Tax=Dorcoceras hygrometricum TaxID=472368 RepID=A0A2Z7A8I1_9LAMI|nr:hypothetical protein F511_25233 [Dorcoceras hygrometricum]
MASSFITKALQVNFDSFLEIQDNEGMVQMFRALEATRLHGFLRCPSVLYEQELEQFFDTTMVQDGDITCAVSEKYVAISEDRFAGIFNLPIDGLTDLSEVPNDLVLHARTLFSKSSVPVQFSCKKRLMKYEFRLLNDILAKSINVKAGSFDAVTHERFLMMTEIHLGIKVNWRKIIFEVLKEMADRTTKRAKGFAAQICVLSKGDPAVTLGEAKTFPPLKIISTKTVNTYIATNKTIDARGESDEPEVAKVAIVKNKSMSKKKSASIAEKDADDVHVEVVSEKAVPKKRPAAVSEATVVVAPISVVPAERPHARKQASKRKLRMIAGSDDEIVEKEPAVDKVVVEQKEQTSVDDVDTTLVPMGPVLGDSSIPRRIVDSVSYHISLPSPHQSPSTASSMHFNAEDISLGTDTVEQILLPTTAAPTTDLSEQFAQLRASISQLSIKQLQTQSSIGNLQNHLLSRIDDLEKAYANARTQQDQDLRGHFKSVCQEVQIQKTALSFEVHEFKQGVQAQSGIFSTDLATISKGRDLSKEFDDKLAVIRNALLEFRVETQGQLASLSTNLSELIAFVTKGRDDKKGEVGSSHGRGQPPPGDGGGSGSRSEPS